jgi:hypothetical protein
VLLFLYGQSKLGPTSPVMGSSSSSRPSWTAVTIAVGTVNGVNVSAATDGSISMPLDILDAATDKPLAIVYDADGKVIDALQGTGASSLCFTNSVVEAPPVFTSDAHFSHALVILNGKCATTTDSWPTRSIG